MLMSNPREFVYILAAALTMLGVISVGAGIILLVTKAAGKEMQTIAAQTTNLAQKGIAEEISGLVGNASSLMDALNQLIRTSAGIGIFLVLFGFIMMLSAFLMVKFF